jgi:hypothetical protein
MNYAILISVAYFAALVGVSLNVPGIGAAVFLIGLVMFPHIMQAIPWAIPARGLGAGSDEDDMDDDHQGGPIGFTRPQN